jgi:hypothetical protein
LECGADGGYELVFGFADVEGAEVDAGLGFGDFGLSEVSFELQFNYALPIQRLQMTTRLGC